MKIVLINIEKMKNIINFKSGEKLKIKCINCNSIFARRISELGLFDGSEIEIVKNDNFYPVIIKIFDSQIALGRGEAQKIYGEKI